MLAALQQIKQLEFTGFETSFRNLGSLNSGGAPNTLELRFFGVHIFLPEYEPSTCIAPRDLVIDTIALASRLGAQRLILSGAPATGKANLRVKADALKRLSELTHKVGMQLCYHNHTPELLSKPGSPSELESLAGETENSPMFFVLDAGHAARAGVSLNDLIAKLGARIAAIHLRDSRGNTPVPLGAGDFPLAETAKYIRDSGWSGWLIAEEEREDGSKPGLNAVATARAELRKAFNV